MFENHVDDESQRLIDCCEGYQEGMYYWGIEVVVDGRLKGNTISLFKDGEVVQGFTVNPLTGLVTCATWLR